MERVNLPNEAKDCNKNWQAFEGGLFEPQKHGCNWRWLLIKTTTGLPTSTWTTLVTEQN